MAQTPALSVYTKVVRCYLLKLYYERFDLERDLENSKMKQNSV